MLKAMVFTVVMYKFEIGSEIRLSMEELTFQIVVLENTPESLLDSKEIKPVNPKGNQHWIFIKRIDAEAEVPVLWSLDMRSQLIGKDPDSGKDGRQKEEG